MSLNVEFICCTVKLAVSASSIVKYKVLLGGGAKRYRIKDYRMNIYLYP
jgi:hypothetical protein